MKKIITEKMNIQLTKTLVLPVDVEGEDEIEDDENVFHTKADSRKLQRYLQQEAMFE